MPCSSTFLLAFFAALPTAASAQIYRECDVFVTEEAPGRVHESYGPTGAPRGVFAVALSVNFMAVHTGDSGQHVLVGTRGGGVHEFHRDTGALVRIYNPGGGWQWAGIYAANGDVLIGDMSTGDIRRYDAGNGNFLGVFGAVPGPADMRLGPNGNLFVCSFTTGGVYELNGTTGAVVAHHVPTLGTANDLVFLPDGRRIVTSMATNLAHVFDSSWNQIATFAGTGWGRPHGIDLSPHDGDIYVVDGVTSAVHRFDATTYDELSAAYIVIDSKPVDVEFRRPTHPCGNVVTYGSGCGGLAIDHSGLPVVGATLTLLLRGGQPQMPALLALGDSRSRWNGLPLPLSLAAFGAPGCSLFAAPLVTLGTVVGSGGDTALPLALPAAIELVAARFFLQWLAVDPRNALGVSSSDGAEVLLGR